MKNKKINILVAVIVTAIVVSIICVLKNITHKYESEMLSAETKRAMTYGELTEEDEKVEGTDNVRFSAFFTRDLDGDGYAEKLKGTCSRINARGQEELNKRLLYINFNVLGDGKFKNGEISINNKNFTWKTSITRDNIVKEDYNGNVNKIKLNDELLGGSQKLFSGSISPDIKDNINNYSEVCSVTLTGTFVDDDENEVTVNKTIDLTVDWYGITKTTVNKYNLIQTQDIDTLIKDEKVQVKFDAIVTENEEELLLEKQVAVIELPELNGYKPTNAYTTYNRVIQNFDSEKSELTLTNNASVKQDGTMQVKISKSNKYEIIAEYPLEAYTTLQNGSVSLDIPIKGYNYGFNNPNNEFNNPYISEDSNIITLVYQDIPEDETIHSDGYIVPPTPVRTTWKLNVSVGDYVYSSETGGKNRVSKDPIIERYNGNIFENIEDTYKVKWDVTVGWHEKMAKIILEEPTESEIRKSDKFLNNDRQYYSMRDYESTVGVKFTNAYDILGINGYIKVYNAETDTLIETFTKENWDKYYNINIEDLKSIKIETSVPVRDGILSIEQTKKIDDEKVVEDFTKEDFQKMRYIYSYLKGTIEAKYNETFSNGGTTLTSTSSNYAYYEEAVSLQSISIGPNQITNQETKNVNIKINTKSQNSYEKKWTNGVFLVEIPEDIIYVQVNNVFSYVAGLRIRDWGTYEENNKHYIKIYTENDAEKLYEIMINADITANPLKATKIETIKLYAYNPNCNNYYNSTTDIYDIDEDSVTQDAIGYATTELTTSAPSGLVTAEYVTNYDENNSITIAPNVAEIEKADGARTATVNVTLANNYTGTISEVAVLGRFPYEGNKFILINRDMKSEYTAHVTGPITVPQSQINNAIVYYSENGEATKDLSDANNRWITAQDVTDWSLIKSYLVDFGNYVFTQASNDTFTYEVEIPAGTGYDEATFSNHAIFYNLHTENGLLAMQTEPNRVGMQVVGKFNLQITKNNLRNINTKVKGAKYKVEGKDANGNLISKIATTNNNGELVLEGIYIGREYILEEVSCPEDYELSNEKIKFNTDVDDQGNLIFNVINDEESGINGNFVDSPVIEIDNNGNYIVKTRLEDEAKWTLNINKTAENGELLQGVQFLFGVDNSRKIYVTDNSGKITIKGLSLDKEYKIQEIKADGYYVDDTEKTLKVFRCEENGESILKVESNDEKYDNTTIEYPDGVAQTQVELNVTNEKIPTYKLQVLKVNKAEEENVIPLSGAYFRVASTDTGKQEEYKTNENGIIEVDGLYVNVEGKNITGEYLLQETKAPGGYTNSAEEIRFVINGTYNEQTQNYDLEVNVDEQEELESLKEVKIEDNILKIVVEDRPLFKLTKVDSETGELLTNVEFIIYKVEEAGTIDFAKDEYGNYIGTINANGDYIVTTDENGVMTLPLPNGTYCAVEVTYPEGYQEKSESEYFKIGDDKTENTASESEQGNNENNNQGNDTNEIIEINYIEDLVELSNTVNRGESCEGKTIKLMRTLDFNDDDSYRAENTEIIKTELTTGSGFIPIGNDTNNFNGIFDGQKYEIRNLYVNTTSTYGGLFGYISNAEIKNLGVTGVVSSSSSSSSSENYNYAGGIAGYVGSSTIINCYNTVDVSSSNSNSNSNSEAGGIAGYVGDSSTIINCYNTGDASSSSGGYSRSNSDAGGIAGKVEKSTITNCYNTGDVSSSSRGGYIYSYSYSDTGGIAGYVGSSTIINCYNTGDVSSRSNNSDSYHGRSLCRRNSRVRKFWYNK